MKTTIKTVLAALSMLKLRAQAVGQPGLGVWTFAGEQAAREVSQTVTAAAHQNEHAELSWSRRVLAIVADKKVTPAEQAELTRLSAVLTRCADRSHDITDAVQL